MRMHTKDLRPKTVEVWPWDTFHIPVMTNSTRPCEGLKPPEALSHLHRVSTVTLSVTGLHISHPLG